ncbi:MAG: hypothetical protein ACRDR6_17655 [Pseudonocardiaceae bacterium]
MSIGPITRYSVARDPDPLMRVLNTMGLWKAVLSGGGEPMVEPEFCRLFVNQVDSPNLEEIELITSAHFADDEAQTRAQVRELVGAWRERAPGLARTRLAIRISLDWFHAQRIGVEPAARVIEALGDPEFAEVHCYIRSVLLQDDTTFERLAEALGATLTGIEDYQQKLLLPDGREILVYHKNLIIDGRMNATKLRRLPIGLPNASRFTEFGERFRDAAGKQVPARTYNGPVVRNLDGLACLIEDDGSAGILEGNDPRRRVKVSDVADWPEAVTHLYADPLTVFLVENGPEALASVLAPAFPEVERIAADTNQLYHLTEILLDSADRRLYAMLCVLERHVTERRVEAPEELVERSWSVLAGHGVPRPVGAS